MMRIDFPQGVPGACIDWLIERLGPGHEAGNGIGFDECAWFYERRFEPAKFEAGVMYGAQGETGSYIPSITIRDGSSPMATMFALRWSGS